MRWDRQSSSREVGSLKWRYSVTDRVENERAKVESPRGDPESQQLALALCDEERRAPSWVKESLRR